MERNNNLNGFNPPGMNGQLPPSQQGGNIYQPNLPFPPQQQLAPGPMAGQPLVPNNYIQTSGTIYFNEKESFTSEKVQSTVNLGTDKHICVLILNIIVIGVAVAAFVIITMFNMPPWIAGQMVGIPYLLYFFLGICINTIKTFLGNIKEMEHVERAYNILKQSQGHIRFEAECYHWTTGKHRRKIVTHKATEIFPLRGCFDESEDFVSLKQNYGYLFFQLSKCFYFGDQNSQNLFLTAFNNFKAANVADKYQSYKHVLDIPTPEMEGAFGIITAGGTGGCLKVLYYIFFLIGLGFPFLTFVECKMGRFTINSVKKLTA